MPKLIDEENKT